MITLDFVLDDLRRENSEEFMRTIDGEITDILADYAPLGKLKFSVSHEGNDGFKVEVENFPVVAFAERFNRAVQTIKPNSSETVNLLLHGFTVNLKRHHSKVDINFYYMKAHHSANCELTSLRVESANFAMQILQTVNQTYPFFWSLIDRAYDGSDCDGKPSLSLIRNLQSRKHGS